jgi:hypothetical protein
MGDIAVSNKVIARDEFGRFISECKIAGENTMRDIAEKGADLSRQLAPKGHKPDPRTRRLVEAITSSYTATTAHWEADARHAIAQEQGAGPHEISGNVSFFWEKMGRMWRPGKNMIQHPGNRAQPYLRPAYQIMMATWMDYARRYYPQ